MGALVRKRKRGRLIPAMMVIVALLGLPFAGPAQAASGLRNSLSIFAGVFTTSFWARSFSVGNVGYEPNFVLAIISERELLSTSWGLSIGHESGIALRFGREFSVETWRGMTISFGALLKTGVLLTPQMVLGLSYVSNPIGMELQRELDAVDGDVSKLIYLGSEVSQSLPAVPEVEVFYRLHHRSGALGFWGNVAAGHNANGVGLRINY